MGETMRKEKKIPRFLGDELSLFPRGNCVCRPLHSTVADGPGAAAEHPRGVAHGVQVGGTMRSICMAQIGTVRSIDFRMIEKVLKLVFSVFTVTFAVYMLYDEQSPPLISDAWIMAHSKRH